MPLTKITNYEVMYSANAFRPRLWLKDSKQYVGQLISLSNGAALPQDTMVNSQVQLHYHLDDFQNALDLLRNEKPLSLLYSGSCGGLENGVKTTQEIVAEGEA
ncbi:MAG TPA: hypothetical protein VI338_06845 [Nitrososphaera sp.]|nr:hypothetical protein [Nitrososphaera sp.]